MGSSLLLGFTQPIRSKGEDQVESKGKALTFAAVAIVVLELVGAMIVALAAGPGAPAPLSLGPTSVTTSPSGPTVTTTLSGQSVTTGGSSSSSSQTTSSSATQVTVPAGQRIGWWIADDDIFTTGTVMGTALPWTPQQFFDNYFNTQPYPATMLWVSGLVSSGARAVPSDQEAQWLSQVATLADQHPNIKILMLLFVNLSGQSIETSVISHTSCFTVGRASPMTKFNVCGLTANTPYTINLQDGNHNQVAIIGSFSTNSTGGWSGTFALPNEPTATNQPGNNAVWYLVVQGTNLSTEVALQCDQSSELTSYMNNLAGHPSIYGALFEPEYFGDTPQIQATFRSIVTGAGYYDLAGQSNPNNDPILAYSSYPYFGGALDTVPQTNQIGVHYGETGQPIAPDPMPIWTQSTVTNIVDNSVPLPCTIIISENDVNNPAGNSYLWASSTLRGWVWNDPHYQSAYLLSTGGGTITTTTTASTTPTTATSTSSSATSGGSASGIAFSSYNPSIPFTYGQNFQTRGNSFTLEIPATASVNMLAFYFSDRAYDPNPVPFTITDPSGTVVATGTIPALLQYASLQWYPIQLSQTVTLVGGTAYTVTFAQLPSGDNYGNAGISQDIIQQATSSPGVGYLGQAQWPLFEVGLMNLLPQSSGLAYRNYGPYTDLFASPGYQGNGEIAMRFLPSQTEQLQTFEINIWRSDNSADVVTFDLRPDMGGHPGQASTTIASASLAANQAVAGTFATVTFSTGPQLTGGTYYWIVMSNPSGTQPIIFGRLVNPYREYVLESHNDFATWGPPSDGPSDLGFRITTSIGSIVNTVSGSDYHDYLSGIAQSFIPTTPTRVSGAWVAAAPSGNAFTVSIQTDAGDKPSGTILAQGSDPINTQYYASEPFVYVGFTGSASVSAGTKYWLVVNVGPCLSSLGCSSPSVATTLDFRSDYSLSGFAPPSGTHYELLSGSSWVSTPNGAMTFELVAPAAGSLPLPTTTTTTSSSTSTSTSTSTTSASTTTSSTSTSTTSNAASCSPSGVCLSWGYAPTTTAAWSSTQWQGVVTVPSGTNPVGISTDWYLDNILAYSTATVQGGSSSQGASYFNGQLSQGTHTLFFKTSQAQSPVLTITVTAGGTTTTTTSSSSSSTSTSSSSSTTSTTTTTYLVQTTSTTSTSVPPAGSSSTTSTTTGASTSTPGGSTTTSVSSTTTSSLATQTLGYAPPPTGYASNQNYNLAFTTSGSTVLQGTSLTAIIDVEPNSMAYSQVALYVESAPSGVSASLQPDQGPLPFSATLVLVVSPGTAPGTYSVVIGAISKGGNQSIAYTLTVRQAATTSHNVTVVVRDIYGVPVSGAQVTLNMAGWSPTLKTGGSGAVVFASVPAGPFNATISYMGASATLSGNSTSDPALNVTVVLSPPVAISAGVFVLVGAALYLGRIRKMKQVSLS